MVLLLSRQDDGSTREVSEWLTYLGKDFLRINADDGNNQFVSCDLKRRHLTFLINNKRYTLNAKDINSVWYRRTGFSMFGQHWKNKGLRSLFFDQGQTAENHLDEESQQLLGTIYFLLQNRKNTERDIGNPFFNTVNKLVVLQQAADEGLDIPNTYIVTTKRELENLLKKEKKLITKAIGDGVYRFVDGYGYYSYTEKVTARFVNALPDAFFPSLIQKEVEKEYELRIFFLKKKFYSMAIFSNEFNATRTDSRKNAGISSLPRRVPYKLPTEVERKLLSLMKQLKLNTGSIDMIVTPQKKYYFLEVNPVGQFGMVSKPCNYYLEREIAQIL